jgi:hypothetical protein
MAAAPYRCTVTIDGTKFDAICAKVKFDTDKDRAGMPMMGSLKTTIAVFADMHDDKNLPFSAIKKFFELANVVTRDKIKAMKIENWKDDSHQDALWSYSFSGWVRRFEVSNPHPVGLADFEEKTDWGTDVPHDVNHLLVLELEPSLNSEKFKDIKLSN